MLRLIVLVLLSFGCEKKIAPTVTPIKKNGIAVLKSFMNDVEFKENQDIKWKTVYPELQFQPYDRVKTGSRSRAEVVFIDHSILTIQPESMAIIVNRTKTHEDLGILEINRGNVYGELLGSKDIPRALEFRNKKKVFKVKNKSKQKSKFTVQLKKENIEIKNESQQELFIEVNKKEVPIKFNKTEVISNQEQTVVVEKTKTIKPVKIKPFYRIDSPKKDQSVTTDSILIKGESYRYKILLNGKEISNNKTFQSPFKLNPGLNILTFQFIHNDKVEFKVIKVTRK